MPDFKFKEEAEVLITDKDVDKGQLGTITHRHAEAGGNVYMVRYVIGRNSYCTRQFEEAKLSFPPQPYKAAA